MTTDNLTAPEPTEARFILMADHEDGAEFFYCRDETHLEQQLATVLFGPSPGGQAPVKTHLAELFEDGIANTDGAFDVYLHRLVVPGAPADTAPVEFASRGVIAAAETLIAADRAQVLTTEHVEALENAIAIQRGTVALPLATGGPKSDVLAQLEAGTAIKRWIREHKVELNEVEFGRIDASLERLMMKLALEDAARAAAAQTTEPVYRLLRSGDIIHATDEVISDNFTSWERVDEHYPARLAGDATPAGYASICRGMPYGSGMKPIRRVVTCAAVENDVVAIGGSVYRRAGGFKEVRDGRNLPVFIAEGPPDARELGEHDEAVARSKRILALVDEYTERQTSANRAELRGALLDEFTLLLAVRESWTVARVDSDTGPVVTLAGYFRKNGKRWDRLRGRPNPETIKTGWVPFYAPQADIREGDDE